MVPVPETLKKTNNPKIPFTQKNPKREVTPQAPQA
jgi:hypothetical protein